ncbi:MAG TPA: ATP synthase subunit C [Sedimentibacter sp.]|mgnify:CR=1 FL=1|jgi:V/A-type H+-transporting ATPase subunit K|nr:ATPase [Sedimentibacter sp.]HHZ00900.1 ATPase [Tissierellia bacterium]HOK48592.1 ATP synthase subunit C [Sedimentibacter sp.]HOW23028.1 ATP synthase subunit C [Sedimentibacter sp.]HRC80892.1 ATP synthase subunit C [Sedimentibacter sp.]
MQILFIILGAGVAAGTIFYGVKAMKKGKKGNIKRAVMTTVSAFCLIMLGAVISSIFGTNAFAETEAVQAAETANASLGLGEGLKYISAALCTAVATLATAKAVSSVGSSAVGAVSEDPSLLGKTLIFVGMAEGIAIYGMIISILILFA